MFGILIITIIYNEYYTGDLYFTEKNNNILKITNINNGTVVEVNLDVLLENMPNKANAINYVLELPAEVIIDMWCEAEYYWGSSQGTGGTYFLNGDVVRLNNFSSIVHETGHAIDDLGSYFSKSKEFKNAFNEGLKSFLADGNTKYEGSWKNYGTPDEYYSCDTDGPYCTSNEQEMFAECYALCMGYSYVDTAEVVIKYFPECLELVKEQIEYVRSLSASGRSNVNR